MIFLLINTLSRIVALSNVVCTYPRLDDSKFTFLITYLLGSNILTSALSIKRVLKPALSVTINYN